jgi:catechol 2,3-dioxygenase-like lactoylglutathione lyase family enzyme
MTATIRLGSVSLDCADPQTLADFWATLLGGEIAFRSDTFVAVQLDAMWLTTVAVENYVAPTWPSGDSPKQIHLDLAVKDLAAAAQQALALGATRGDVQPNPDSYLVFIDPAGHPFCLTTQIPD